MNYFKRLIWTVAGSFIFVSHANADQVILDDLIVDGSICAGLDCVNGESFGFDTLRLKENNLRIKFQDTSSSASFPTNDWQLTANDSSNGGQNKFSIDDIDGGRTPFTIEASAPSHSLYVDDGGRVGFGTSTPVADLHVKSGNTPTLRLEQDGSSGFTPQTWDLAGNEANFFIRDATNGSTLPFRVFPGAPSNALNIEASTGDIGMGTTSPDANLDIEDNGPAMRLTNTGAGGTLWELEIAANSGRLNIANETAGVRPLKIDPTAIENLMRLGTDTAGNINGAAVAIGAIGSDAVLTVQGSIQVDGVVEHADFVFENDYDLKTIEERAAFMWENKHLPSLQKAPEGLKGRVDLVGHQMGVLEEVEVAHIYIQQLHESIKTLEARIAQMENER